MKSFRSDDMKLHFPAVAMLLVSASTSASWAQQAPWGAPDVPATHADRVYAAEQFSNTVSVTDPVDGRQLGVIRLGDPQPMNFSPLYRGQVLVHGLGFSPDGRTLAVVSIGSNSVTFIDTATNAVRHTTYVGRSPHEAFYTPDGKEVWVTVRGEDYVAVLDAATFAEKTQLRTPGGPGMTTFSPDGRYSYVCSSFNPVLTVFDARSREVVGTVPQPSPFCPNIAATPDGRQVWFTLKDVGKTVAFDAKPPFPILKIIDTGPITNHVNFAVTPQGQFAYVSVGGLNQVKVYRTTDFSQVATVAVGKLPHGVWPSGDGKRIYLGLENDDRLAVVDTSSNDVIRSVPIGQAPQAIAYVPNAVRTGAGTENLVPLAVAGNVKRLTLAARGDLKEASSISLFDQGLIQILQGAVTGLRPGSTYFLALARSATGGGPLEPLAKFVANPAGAAIVNATGPIRQIVAATAGPDRRWIVIAEPDASGDGAGRVVQIQTR
jgi:YVTN family beta-propeller protein